MVIRCSDSFKLSWFLTETKEIFPIHDLGASNYFLGIEVRVSDSLLLTKNKYAADLLKETSIKEYRSYITLMTVATIWSKTMDELLSNSEQYCQIVCSLQYMTLTRLVLSNAKNV